MWWELFRLSDLSEEDLLEEQAGLSGLTLVGGDGGTVAAPIHRYRFPPQETELRGGEELRRLSGKVLASKAQCSAIVSALNSSDTKCGMETAAPHDGKVILRRAANTEMLYPALNAVVPLAFWHLTYSLRRCHKISATLVQISHAPGHHTTPGSRFSTMGTRITGLLPMTTPMMTARQKPTRSFRSRADI